MIAFTELAWRASFLFLEDAVEVGGAVLTEEYAKKINADYYAKDAKSSVEIAKLTF